MARAIVRSSGDANEVACDVYVQVWQTAGQFDATRGSALSWLLTITRTRSLDLLRGRQRRESIFVPDAAPELEADHVWENPEQLLDLFQSGTEVHRALAALTPLRQELIGMAFFGDLSHTEIAAQTGLPLGTVKSHLRKALQALHAALET